MGRPATGTSAVRRRQRRSKATFLDRLPMPLHRWLSAEIGPFARALTDRSILAILLLTVVGLVGLYQLPQTNHVDVGVANGRDGFYLRDFFAKETVGDATFRWIGQRAAIVLPGAAGNSQWQMTARIAAPRPPVVAADTPPATLAIFADALLRERQRTLGWGLLAVIATFMLFAAVHVVSGLRVRYFVFLGPALGSVLGLPLRGCCDTGAGGVAWPMPRSAMAR